MISRSVWLKADETRMTLSRAHTHAKAASVTKLLLLHKRAGDTSFHAEYGCDDPT